MFPFVDFLKFAQTPTKELLWENDKKLFLRFAENYASAFKDLYIECAHKWLKHTSLKMTVESTENQWNEITSDQYDCVVCVKVDESGFCCTRGIGKSLILADKTSDVNQVFGHTVFKQLLDGKAD